MKFAVHGDQFETMDGLDLSSCLDFADAFDPFRGPEWLRGFHKRARMLGYGNRPEAGCRCSGVHNPACGLAKRSLPAVPVFPHDLDGMPAGMLLLNVDRLPSHTVYEAALSHADTLASWLLHGHPAPRPSIIVHKGERPPRAPSYPPFNLNDFPPSDPDVVHFYPSSGNAERIDGV